MATYQDYIGDAQGYMGRAQAADPSFQEWQRNAQMYNPDMGSAPAWQGTDYFQQWMNSLPPAQQQEYMASLQANRDAQSKTVKGRIRTAAPYIVVGGVGGAALAPLLAAGGAAGGVSAAEIAGAAGMPELGMVAQTGLGVSAAGGAAAGGTTLGTALTTAGKYASPFVSALTGSGKSSVGGGGGGSGNVYPGQEALADAQLQALRDQLGFNKEQFDYYKGLTDKQYQLGQDQFAWQRGLADDAKARAGKYDALYDETTGAGLRNFTKAVNAYDTGAERDKIAGRSMVDVEDAFERGQQGLSREFAARGLNQGSPAAIAAMVDANTQKAMAKSSAATMAQEAARREGLTLRQTAAGLGQPNANVSTDSSKQASEFGAEALRGANTSLTPSFTNLGLYNQGQTAAIGWGNSAANNYNSLSRQDSNPWYKNLNYGQGLGGALAGYANNGLWGGLAGAAGGLLSGG